MPEDIIRRFFPSEYPCPHCGGSRYGHNSHYHNLQYRDCKEPGCGRSYKVFAIAVEIRQPGQASRIRLITGSDSI